MNKLILAAAVALPVAFFAVDKNSASFSADSKKSDRTEVIAEDHTTSFVGDEVLVSELKMSIANKEARQEEYYNADIQGLWSDDLKKETTSFLKNKVVKKMEKANVCSIDLKESFSRCPSGYNAYVIMNNGQATNEGYIVSNSGCDSDPLAKIRFDVPSQKVECFISAKAGYVGLDDFLALYKKALEM